MLSASLVALAGRILRACSVARRWIRAPTQAFQMYASFLLQHADEFGQIVGYQVLDKYLKSRKGHEINHVAAIADRLAFTIEQMAIIEKAYKRAFGQRG